MIIVHIKMTRKEIFYADSSIPVGARGEVAEFPVKIGGLLLPRDPLICE